MLINCALFVISRMYDTFMSCLKEVYVPHIEMCPDDYLWMSLQEFSWYISQHMGGFDYMLCKGRSVLIAQ